MSRTVDSVSYARATLDHCSWRQGPAPRSRSYLVGVLAMLVVLIYIQPHYLNPLVGVVSPLQPSLPVHDTRALTLRLVSLAVSFTHIMVAINWGDVAARAAVLASPVSNLALSSRANGQYVSNAVDASTALKGWYDNTTGLWTATGWWNSANCLTVLADFAVLDSSDAASLGIAGLISNTFTAAQQATFTVAKQISPIGLYRSTYTFAKTRAKRAELAAQGFSGFLNDYYDDEGWWALGLIRAYDATGSARYLAQAESIFADMQGGGDKTCGGGIWWSKDRAYKNAIANELFLSVAASLANRVSGKQQTYLQIAQTQWSWFKASGMINGNNLINDGLTIGTNGSCTNNGQNTWSYNQGVVLGGLAELYRATNDQTYLNEAAKIADAALKLLVDTDGIIHESGGCEPNCGSDGSQFKGIFVRNLGYLHRVAPQDSYRSVILRNADSIWASDRTSSNQLGISWSGPVEAGGGPNATTHSSAMDVIIAAITAS